MSCFHGMLLALASALAGSGRSDAGADQDEGFRGVRSQAGQDAAVEQRRREDAKEENKAMLAISPKSENPTWKVSAKPLPNLPFPSAFFASSRLCCSHPIAEFHLLTSALLVVSRRVNRRRRDSPKIVSLLAGVLPKGPDGRFISLGSLSLSAGSRSQGTSAAGKPRFHCRMPQAQPVHPDEDSICPGL
jgi:hypothetical protein